MEKDLDMKKHRLLERFLCEVFGKDNKRSAAVYSGAMYYRVYFLENRQEVGDASVFYGTRQDAEKWANDWIMEKINEDQINQLHQAFA